MSRRRATRLPALPRPGVCLTESAQDVCTTACRLVREQLGRFHEVGVVVAGYVRGHHIYGTHAVVPTRQTVTMCTFRVPAPDRSAANRAITDPARGRYPRIWVHPHPTPGTPRPSAVDDRARDRAVQLLERFLQRDLTVTVPLAAVAAPGEWRWHLPRLNRRVDIVAARPTDAYGPAPELRWREVVPVSRHVFLITNEDGDFRRCYGEVVEAHGDTLSDDPGARPTVVLHEDVRPEVLPDALVAERLGLPLADVQCRVDEDDLRRRIATFESGRYGTGYGRGAGLYGDDDEDEDDDDRSGSPRSWSTPSGGAGGAAAGGAAAWTPGTLMEHELRFLRGGDGDAAVATLLREVAAVLAGDPAAAGAYLAAEHTTRTDLRWALREALTLLAGGNGGGGFPLALVPGASRTRDT